MVDMSQVDLEYGYGDHRRLSSTINNGGDCFSDADQFHSTVQSFDLEHDAVLEIEMKEQKIDRDCRICHLSMEGGNAEGLGIDLGCCCKDDLAAVHKSCAEAWFKIKGDKTCEICNSLACNVLSTNETDSTQQTNDPNVTTTDAVSARASSSTENRSCINGHRFVNFLLACMVFVFVISWLFHFNIPS